MDTQNAVLSKIVLEEDLLPFIEVRISREFFPDPNHARIWDMVMDHFKKYGKPPSAEAIHQAYPTYKFVEYPEPTSFYLNRLQQDRKSFIYVSMVQEIANLLQKVDEGPNVGDEMEAILQRGMSKAARDISQGRDVDFFLDIDRYLKDLRDRVASGNKLRGISTSLHAIDDLTGGFQEENLITVVGTSKAGKSSMLLKMAWHARRHGHRVLFVTFEMSSWEQEQRLSSLISGVALTKILNGAVDADEEKKISEALRLRQNMEGFIITSDITSTLTVSGIQAKIQQYAPALVIIDGMYMMDDEAGNEKGSPQALTSITRSIKRLAQTSRLPIVVSTQAMLYRSKKGLKLDSIGYSSSFAQDSDIIFGVEKHEHLTDVSKFHILASRSSPRGSTYVHFDWSKGLIEEIDFAQYEMMMASVPNVVPIGGKGKASSSTGMQRHWEQDNAP